MRNSKNWSKVTIGTVEYSKRPTKVGKGSSAKLVGYAQVPMLPDEEFDEAVAKDLLTDWLDTGVLGYKQVLTAAINALAVQVQAAVRRRYESAVNGTMTEDQLFNVGFAKLAADNKARFNTIIATGDANKMRSEFVNYARQLQNTGEFDPEQNVVTLSSDVQVDDNIQQQ